MEEGGVDGGEGEGGVDHGLGMVAMWRRVSCEQPLNTSQSILRLSGSIVQWSGDLSF